MSVTTLEKSRILVVEDEPLVGMEIQDSLIRLGYDVPQVINNGDAVLESALRMRPDLILMDIRLKGFLDGIDAAQRLRMISDVPIIYLTAYSNPEVLNRAIKTEPAAYILKPFDEKELHANITLALSRSKKNASSETQRVGGTIINALHTPALLTDEGMHIRAANSSAVQLLRFTDNIVPNGAPLTDFINTTDWTEQESKGFFPIRWKTGDAGVLDLHMRVERFPQTSGSESIYMLLFEAVDPRERKLMENIGKDLNAEVKSLLPPNGRIVPGVDMAGHLIPCSSGSGDLYDLFRLDEHTVVFYLLDVMGHGSLPALFACVLHEVIRSRAAQELGRATRENRTFSPGKVLSELNRKYQRKEGQSRFFTTIFGVLDPTNGKARIVRAGHPPILHVKGDKVERIQPETGVALGIFEEARFSEVEIDLASGERLVLFSDGFLDGLDRAPTESRDKAIEKALDLLTREVGSAAKKPLPEMLSVLMHDWNPDEGPDGQKDDASLFLIERL